MSGVTGEFALLMDVKGLISAANLYDIEMVFMQICFISIPCLICYDFVGYLLNGTFDLIRQLKFNWMLIV